MTMFWITAAGMIALAILFVVPPLLRFKPVETASSDELNVTVIKQQLRELQADLDAGELDQEQYDASRHDLEKELLADTEDNTPEEELKSGRWAVFAIPLFIPIIAFPVYSALGNPEIISRLNEPVAQQQQRADHGSNPDTGANGQEAMAAMEELISRLAERLEENPDNAEGWSMLGRSYISMGRMDDAMKAYERGAKLFPKEVDLLMGYASTLARTQGNQFFGKPAELIDQAFQLQPDNTNVIWLKGNIHYQAGEFAQAIPLWEKVLHSLEPGSEGAMTVAEYLRDARSKIPPGVSIPTGTATSDLQPVPAGAIRVKINLHESMLSHVLGNGTVFIFARAVNGPQIPLAAVRKPIHELPIEVILDDSMSMSSELVLSKFSEVKVEARISKSGDPTPQSGDVEGTVILAKPGQKETVEILLDTLRP